MTKIKQYIKIINDLGCEMFGEGYIDAEAANNNERLHVRITIKDMRPTPYTFIIENGKYVLTDGWMDKIELKLDSIEVFEEYAKQVLLQKCQPEIISYFKMGYIDELPSKLNIVQPTIYLNKITVGWFNELFDECTYNGEKAENVQITKTDEKIVISFDADCNRYGVHRYNDVTINNRGRISYGFQEIVEGIIDFSDFEQKITEYITTK